MMPDYACTHDTHNSKCDPESLSGCMLVLLLASAIDDDGRSRRSGTALPVRSGARQNPLPLVFGGLGIYAGRRAISLAVYAVYKRAAGHAGS